MCGIFATTDADNWRSRLPLVLKHLERRGPDEQGQHSPDPDILLGHTRLSIIGLGPAGAQPATSADGTVSLTMNGEIYNYRDIASRRFGISAQSDTQVLADLLAARRDDLLCELRGMWAFAAWDSSTATLRAMRDPYGIKPLYLLRHADGAVTLSSELPPLLMSPDSRRIDELGLGQFLAMGFTGPTSTMFASIQKLVPGRLYEWKREDVGRWTAAISTPGGYPVPSVPSVDEALEDSVAAHLVADVEVGAFLSGGVDSTLLSVIAQRQQPPLRTFTLAFPEAPQHDESHRAAHNAQAIGTRHTTVPITAPDMAIAATVFIREHGEAFGDAAALPLTHLARAASSHVKVVLCGEGADELFGGYARYRISRRLGRTTSALGPLTRPLAPHWSSRRSGKPWARAAEAVLWGGGIRAHAALLDADLPLLGATRQAVHRDLLDLLHTDWEATSGGSEVDRARAYDRARWLPNVYLEKTDRATMAASLEARVPFLDPVMAAAARGVQRDELKRPLREALQRRLPTVALPDRKKGLAVDIVPVVRGHLEPYLTYELGAADSLLSRWCGQAGTRRVADRSQRSPYMLFRLAMLGLWEHEFDGNAFTC